MAQDRTEPIQSGNPNAPKTITLQDGGVLTLTKQIGKGEFGEVYAASYEGNDPRLLAMGDLVVKIGKLERDIEIANFFAARLKKHPNRFGNFDQLVSAGYSPPGTSEPLVISTLMSGGNLYNFIGNAINNNIPAFNQHNLGNTLGQLAASMKAAQDMVHEAGV